MEWSGEKDGLYCHIYPCLDSGIGLLRASSISEDSKKKLMSRVPDLYFYCLCSQQS